MKSAKTIAEGKAVEKGRGAVERLSFESPGDIKATSLPPALRMPAWRVRLVQGHQLEPAGETARAQESLPKIKNAIIPAGPWRAVSRLLDFRLIVREARQIPMARLLPRLKSFANNLAESQRATRARAYFLLGVLHHRLGNYNQSEKALSQALALVEDAPARIWILDSSACCLQGQGAWTEARPTWEKVLPTKREMGDKLGTAISLGSLAQMEREGGKAERAVELLRKYGERKKTNLPLLTRLRLQTQLIDALYDAGRHKEVLEETPLLQRLLVETGKKKHYLQGFACLALAKSMSIQNDPKAVGRWLRQAEKEMSSDDQRAFIHCWEARLFPDRLQKKGGVEKIERLCHPAGEITDADLEMVLLLCEHFFSTRQEERLKECLSRAVELAIPSNNRRWLERVAQVYRRLAPLEYPEMVIRLFSGWELHHLPKTVREEVPVIFTDLVKFTDRSVELEPEEIMETVRSLFELSVSLLQTHQVRPISYLGDGLLAVGQGENHRERGLQFALDVVSRALLVTAVRKALGEKNGDWRCGAAWPREKWCWEKSEVITKWNIWPLDNILTSLPASRQKPDQAKSSPILKPLLLAPGKAKKPVSFLKDLAGSRPFDFSPLYPPEKTCFLSSHQSFSYQKNCRGRTET